jgi:hypothetical protein
MIKNDKYYTYDVLYLSVALAILSHSLTYLNLQKRRNECDRATVWHASRGKRERKKSDHMLLLGQGLNVVYDPSGVYDVCDVHDLVRVQCDATSPDQYVVRLMCREKNPKRDLKRQSSFRQSTGDV